MKLIKFLLLLSLALDTLCNENINDNNLKHNILKYEALLNQYPQLTNEVFGTTDIKQLNTKVTKSDKYKKIISEIKQMAKITGGSILAAISYGIIHDQITARICLEYFSKSFHKRMMDQWGNTPLAPLKKILENSNSPTTYGLIWGIVATWWMGAILGIPLSLACRLGNWPKIEFRETVKPIGCVLATMGISSLLAGLVAYSSKNLTFSEKLLEDVTPQNRFNFIVDAHAHTAAYASGIIGGISCMGYVIYKRYLKQQENKKKAQKELLKLIEDKNL